MTDYERIMNRAEVKNADTIDEFEAIDGNWIVQVYYNDYFMTEFIFTADKTTLIDTQDHNAYPKP